jgi:hypothetical protein
MKSDSSELTKSWEKIFNQETLKSNLSLISLYIMTFELLKDSIETTVDNFFSIEYEKDKAGNKKKIINEEYKVNVLSLLNEKERKNNQYIKASLRWLKEFNILDSEDEIIYDELRIYRNDLTHEFITYLIDNEKNFDKIKMNLLIELFVKLEKKWVLEFEIPVNPDYDGQDIQRDDVSSGKLLILGLIHNILSHNDFSSFPSGNADK